MLISLLLFTLCYLVAFLLAQYSYNLRNATSCRDKVKVYTQKMPLLSVLLVALLCTFYNFVVTSSAGGEYGSDRLNYLTSFDYGRFESPGLMYIMYVVHEYGGSFNIVLYISTFISVVCVMLAYKYSRDATPLSLMVFFMSPFVFQTFTALKQCYATGFATLCIMLLLQKRTILKELLCFLLIVLSCLFHSAGYLLVIIYLLLRIDYKVKNVWVVFLISITIVILFKPILLLISSLVSGFIPFLAQKITEYFGEDGMEAERGVIVVLKGLPYYYILYLALKYKKRLRNRILDYDKYLLITVIGSLFYLVTIYNVWMRRATDLLTFAMIVFWAQIISQLPNSGSKKRIEIFLMLLFTYRWLIMIYINFGLF